MSEEIPLSRKRNLPKPLKMLLTCLLLVSLSATPVLVSCGSKKPRVVTTKKRASRTKAKKPARTTSAERTSTSSDSDRTGNAGSPASSALVDKAINAAMSYKGTKWKYAGNDKRGMDCSGLICTSYKEAGKKVPRTTWTLKEASTEIDLDAVQKGDLLFFATGSNKKRLNHVAMVVNVTPAEIQFIHSSTSRGVIVSSLNEPFWLGSYLSAGRLE